MQPQKLYNNIRCQETETLKPHGHLMSSPHPLSGFPADRPCAEARFTAMAAARSRARRLDRPTDLRSGLGMVWNGLGVELAWKLILAHGPSCHHGPSHSDFPNRHPMRKLIFPDLLGSRFPRVYAALCMACGAQT